MKKWALLFTAILIISCLTCFAEEIVSPNTDFYNYDEVGVLSKKVKGEIYYSNKLLYESCGAQIVVVVINSTGTKNIEQYSIELFNNWGIGDKEKNNGFLLLLSIQDDNYYACPGSGLAAFLPSEEILEMFNQYLETDFAATDYDSGTRKIFEAVFDYVAKTYHAGITVQDGIREYEKHR